MSTASTHEMKSSMPLLSSRSSLFTRGSGGPRMRRRPSSHFVSLAWHHLRHFSARTSSVRSCKFPVRPVTLQRILRHPRDLRHVGFEGNAIWNLYGKVHCLARFLLADAFWPTQLLASLEFLFQRSLQPHRIGFEVSLLQNSNNTKVNDAVRLGGGLSSGCLLSLSVSQSSLSFRSVRDAGGFAVFFFSPHSVACTGVDGCGPSETALASNGLSAAELAADGKVCCCMP